MKKLILATFAILVLTTPQSHAGETAIKSIAGDVFVSVNGLVCDFCARALEKVFGKRDAVNEIDVNLDDKVVTIDFKDGQSMDEETIKSLITDSGYNVVEVRYAD